MSTIVKETQGDTLQGAIDGSNRVYTTSLDFQTSFVNVFVNGLLRVQDWENGYDLTPPRTVTMREPLLVGDSLEVEYRTGALTGGGALGGVPKAPQTQHLLPTTRASASTSRVAATNLEPGTTTGHNKPQTVPITLRPVTGASEDSHGCD